MENCIICGSRILVTIFRGSGFCCELCRKAKQGDKKFNKDQN